MENETIDIEVMYGVAGQPDTRIRAVVTCHLYEATERARSLYLHGFTYITLSGTLIAVSSREVLEVTIPGFEAKLKASEDAFTLSNIQFQRDHFQGRVEELSRELEKARRVKWSSWF